ncbi:MAG: hypothetical protein FGM32_11065 [Candidatus Kapabacteria bacterium]|nr:hypothetical protein [Candidatus Kapabacteria bacterium]
MNECLFDSSIAWMVVDTLAAFCLSVCPHAPSTVWYAVEGGLIRTYSIERRKIVRTLVVDTSNPQGRITNIVFDPRDPATVYAAGILMQGVYRSTDGGNSWSVVRRHDSYLTNYAGECLKAIPFGDGVRLVAGNFSRGELEYSDDAGKTWSSSMTGHTGSICSIATSSEDPENVVLGCKYGKLLRVALPARKVELTGVIAPNGYYEIPRIAASVEDNNVFYAISAGFDSTSKAPGLFQSCDRGRSWTRSWLHGVNIWAMAECESGRHIFIGGFSEFRNVTGRGIVACVDVHTDNVRIVGGAIPWNHAPGSVWDMKFVSRNRTCKQSLLIATDDGVYIGYAAN